MAKPIYLETLGHIAVTAQTPVSEVQRILKEIGAKPEYVINCIPHYSAMVAGTVIARAMGWTNQAAYHRRYDSELEIRING